ncbi:DsbA family protein [Kitasatospora sp. NPDC127067]|uniref:DsbA family protein n=1 Tax=Kitasatospora sp. NPDC127067 TaxID=3347126 RepID=UPI003655A48B
MRIEIWADVVCPWAYIGRRRLEAALAGPTLSARDIEVVWRPYLIDPTAPARAVPMDPAQRDPMVDDAAGRCAVDPPTTQGRRTADDRVPVSRIAAAEGLGPNWGAAWRSSSHDAHRLLALAHEHGGSTLQHTVAEHLMRAHFVEGHDISAPDTLRTIAATAGFAEASALLDTDAADRTVRELRLIGKARGIRTSPTIVVGDRALAGAQPPDVIADFLATAGPERDVPEEVERLRYAESLLELRDPLGALTLLRPLLDNHGDDLNVRHLAARAYFTSAQLGRARQTLEQLVTDLPDDSYLRLMLGRTLQRLGLHEQAAPHLKIASAMTPEFA